MYKVYAGIDWILLYVTKTTVDLTQSSRRSLLGYKDKATKSNNKKLQENSQGWQKDGILLPRGAFATPCHSIANGPASPFRPHYVLLYGAVNKFDGSRGGSKSMKALKVFLPHEKMQKDFIIPQ